MKKQIVFLTILALITACQPPVTATIPPNTTTPSQPAITPSPTISKTVCDPSGTFDPKSSYPLQSVGPLRYPLEVINTGDFNGDGLTDVLLTKMNHGTTDTFELEIYLNNGDGSLVFGNDTIFEGKVPRVQHPSKVILADFNGDGVTDIYIADNGMDTNPWPGYQDTLVLSVPGGKVVDATANLPQEMDYTHSAAAADIDNDGDLDLYIGNVGAQNMIPPQIWLNDGAGNFAIADGRLPPGQANLDRNIYTASALADVNNDRFPDLILGTHMNSVESVVLLNDGQGFFSLHPTPLPPNPGAHPGSVTLVILPADINEDGYQDLLVSGVLDYVTNCFCYSGMFIQTLINNGDGTFTDETEARMPAATSPDWSFKHWLSKIELHDLDNDGDLDIATRNNGTRPDNNLFFLNDGNGFYTLADDDYHISVPNLYTFLDIEGDGGLDIFTIFGNFSRGSDWQRYYDWTGYYLIRDIGCKDASRSGIPFVTQTPPTPIPNPSKQQLDAGYVIYDDAVAQGWTANAWGADLNVSSSAMVYAGSQALEATLQPWGSIVLLKDPATDASEYTHLVFYLNGGQTPDQQLQLTLDLLGRVMIEGILIDSRYIEGYPLQADQWHRVVVPLSRINPYGLLFDGIAIGDMQGQGASTFYIDEIRLVAAGVPPTPIPTPQQYFDEEYAIYDDELASGWWLDYWSGQATANSSRVVYAGSQATEVTFQPWGAVSFRRFPPFDASDFTALVFHLNGGETAHQQLYVEMKSGDNVPLGERANLTNSSFVEGYPLQPGKWHMVTIPLSVVNPESKPFAWFDIGDASGIGASTFYVDEIRFVGAGP